MPNFFKALALALSLSAALAATPPTWVDGGIRVQRGSVSSNAATAQVTITGSTTNALVNLNAGGLTGTNFVKVLSATASKPARVGADLTLTNGVINISTADISGILPKANGGAGADQSSVTYPSSGAITISTDWNTVAKIEAITGVNIITSTEIDSIAKLEALIGSLNIILATEIDTSAEIAAIVTDETGSGALVFGTSPTIVTPTIASFVNATHTHQNAAGGGTLDTAAIASGTLAAGRMPALTGDVTTSAGAVATTIAANAVTSGKLATNLVSYHNQIISQPVALGSGTAFSLDPLIREYYGAASGNVTITIATNSAVENSVIYFDLYDSVGGRTITLGSGGTGGAAFAGAEPDFGFGTNKLGTNTLVFRKSGGVWHASQSTAQISTAQIGDGVPTGTGKLVLQTSPTLVTPVLGVASATSIDVGNADTTVARSAAGIISVEGVDVPTVSSTHTLTKKIYARDASGLSDDTHEGDTMTGYNAGEALTQWDVVYLSASSTWLKAKADTAGKFPAVGVVVATTGNGNPATVLTRGVFRDDGGTVWTPGGTLFLSTTAGAMTQTAPTTSGYAVHSLGTAITAHRVQINTVPVWFENGSTSPLVATDIDTSAELAAILTDETGAASGTPLAVFNQSPVIVTPTIASFVNATHNHQAAAGGGTLAEAALALTDVTTANASTTAHGFVPKLPNDATKYYDGTGAYSVPPGTGGGGGTVGTVIGSGTTAANDIAVFNDTTHTNIARSTSTGRLGDNSSATYALTIDLSGTDDVFTFGSALATFSGTFDVNQATADAAILKGRGGSVTASGATTLYDLSGTWNTSGNPTGLRFYVTNTASGTSSLLMDLGVNTSTSEFSVSKAGQINVAASANQNVPALKGGGDNSGFALRGSGNDTIGIVLGGNDSFNFVNSAFIGYSATSIGFSGTSIGSGWSAAADTFFTRESAAVMQLGADAASPVDQTLKANDGSGTDKVGAKLTLEGGQSTGTGRGGDIIVKTTPSSTTGSTANSYSTREYYSAKGVDLPETTPTLFANVSLASSKVLGCTLICTIQADDGTDFQVLNSTLNFGAVNKAGTVTVGAVTQTDAATAASAGTLTCAYTAVANGNGVDIKANATSSLNQTTLKVRWILRCNSDGVATVTPQ